MYDKLLGRENELTVWLVNNPGHLNIEFRLRFYHPHIVIYFFFPYWHLSIRIFPPAFYDPHFVICHLSFAIRPHPVHTSQGPTFPCSNSGINRKGQARNLSLLSYFKMNSKKLNIILFWSTLLQGETNIKLSVVPQEMERRRVRVQV